VGRPERLDLKQILWHFLHFRLEVVTRRPSTSWRRSKRIHILEGFETSSTRWTRSKMIRKSDGKADSAEKIMGAGLDADQTDAILELRSTASRVSRF
jgi:DNA gyrase subunit A